MNIETMLVAVLLVAVVILAFIVIKNSSSQGANSESRLQELLGSVLQDQTIRLLKIINDGRDESKTEISSGLLKTQEHLSETLARSQMQISERLENLVKETSQIKSASENIIEIGKDVNRLNLILEGPKSRGAFGEQQLGVILKDVLPAEVYREQYAVGEGRVDAAILFKEKILCIDSKFPKDNLIKYLEANGDERDVYRKNFKSDVRKHAKDIRKKYIEPGKTLNFAIMFVPSESAFMEIISDHEFHRELLDMQMVPASPNFLYVYLQAVAVGFRGMVVQEKADEIISEILNLSRSFEKIQGSFMTMGAHLDNATKQYHEVEKQVRKFDAMLSSLKFGTDGEKKDG